MKDQGERSRYRQGKTSDDNAALALVKGEGMDGRLHKNNSDCSAALRALAIPKGSSGAENVCRAVPQQCPGTTAMLPTQEYGLSPHTVVDPRGATGGDWENALLAAQQQVLPQRSDSIPLTASK